MTSSNIPRYTPRVSTRQADLLRAVLDSHADEIHTCLPGTIRSYDYTTQTAEIALGVHRVIRGLDGDEDDDTSAPYPILVAVPLIWPGMGTARLNFPVNAGDSVLVLFPEASIDRWLTTGADGDPGLALRHALDGAVAIPGLRHKNNRNGGSPSDAIVLGYQGGTEVKITSTQVQAGGTKALAEADDVKTHLAAISAALATIGAAAGSPSSYTYATTLATAPIETSITKGD